MIALLLDARCTQCNRCVEVCPARVFEPQPDAPPRIARPEACQTCFQCELYCRADALYVDPDCEQLRAVDAATVLDSGEMGSYRRESGWDEYADDPRYANWHWRMEEVFARGRG